MPDVTQGLAFEFKGIGSLIKSGRLKVPLNQREYSWENKQVTELFQDFSAAIRKGQSSYFLGTIVISRGTKNVPEVVDGQQRLATTTILIAAIRDYFYKKNEMLRTSIDTDFLITIDREHEETVPKLSLNLDDNEFFRNRIIALPDSGERRSLEAKKESHKRIAFAAQKASDLVQGISRDNTDTNCKEILNEWLTFLEQKAMLIVLTVPDEMNAFMMFETLNDRGLKTSQADLVKNYLFREATEERIIEAQQKWSKMVSTLETLGIEDIVMTYLRHLVITLFGPTREKEIFTKIRDQVSGRTASISFLDKLASYSDSYAAILTPTHPKWADYPAELHDAVNVLRELKVQQIRPLMLAVAQHFEPKEAPNAFRSFVCWTVRFLISGGMRGGQLEDAYGSKAFEVANGTIKTTSELLKSLQNIIPTDMEFQTAFANARVSQHNLARYYLRAIEAHIRRETDQPELMPVRDPYIINLEHILPENPESNWPHITAEIAEAYTNRIGNLTLMRTRINSQFGNASFQIKRSEFKNSQMHITKAIFQDTSETTEWGPNEINERQKKLAEIAVETWPLASKVL